MTETERRTDAGKEADRKIDELRKDKKNENEKLRFLTQRVSDISVQMEEK